MFKSFGVATEDILDGLHLKFNNNFISDVIKIDTAKLKYCQFLNLRSSFIG